MTRRLYRMLSCLTLISISALAQTSASLQTAETHIEVQAGPHAPRLVALGNRETTWKNAVDELPIRSVEISNQSVPLEWNYNSADSRIDANVVRYVYDSTSPRLRLTWQWEVRSPHGPIEHQISIENRDDHELWLPLQSSFVFEWQIPRDVQLEQFYVEKGADTPSSTGTHRVTVPDGYTWEGTSSTYAQPRPGESREIIPYFLVEEPAATQAGWYVGIEFSGRTHLTLARSATSLHGEVGLNPNPGPFRTRLRPAESFDPPRVFLGATSGGPDATGNTLHRWVREVLANPEEAQ